MLLKEELEDPAAAWTAGRAKPGSQERVTVWNWGWRWACPCSGAALLPSKVVRQQLSTQVLVLAFCFVVLATFLNLISFSRE